MEGALVALALLACPVGMGLMMWFMSKGMRGGQRRAEPERERPASIDELRSEHARLSADIQRLERAGGARDGEPAGR
ncbi:MAG: hypothetical protein ACRDSN_03245 [Pseudonocardiaceae bacterium]